MIRQVVTIDGASFDVGVTRIRRKSRIQDGQNAGDAKRGDWIRDVYGTFKRDNTVLEPAPGRNFYSIKELASRHQSGEDFVMADWTPAYLDYGERVLTASENAKYTAMGGVDGMERSMASSGGSGGGADAEEWNL